MALINDFMSLIYPRFCEACGLQLFKHEKQICRHCLLHLPKSGFHLDPENPISNALAGRVPVEKVLCLYLFEKSGKVQKLIHAIKYQEQKELAIYLGQLLGREFKQAYKEPIFDLILPVPLHPNKLTKRGYNQSELFALGISRELHHEMSVKLLVRKTDSATQTRKKKFERWENVEGIFNLFDPSALENKHILLVDDVVTTGATIDSVCQCLKDIRGLKISLACIAFAKKT